MRFFACGCKEFRKEARGSVAIVFALAIMAVVLVVGIGVDYGQISLAQSHLQSDADSAVLAAVSAQNSATSLTSATIQAQAVDRFKSLAEQNGVTVTAASATATTTPAVTLTYSATVPSTFGKIVGLQTYSVSGAASATGSGAQYIDIYLLVDVSGSMGIGATTADQTLMDNTPNLNCAFGCHMLNTDAIARAAGATLRIDVVKQALTQIIGQAESASAANNQIIRFALFTFATNATENQTITSNYADIANAVSNIQLAGLDAGTSTANALTYLAGNISSIGDGGSAATPKVYVILATDGTGDASDNYGGHGDRPAPNFVPPYSMQTVVTPFPHAVPLKGSLYRDFELEGIDPSWCQSLKTMGATVMTLDMPYVIPAPIQGSPGDITGTTADKRLSYISDTLLPLIPTQMSDCASGSQYSLIANSPSDIMSAMSQLFSAVEAGTPRITR